MRFHHDSLKSNSPGFHINAPDFSQFFLHNQPNKFQVLISVNQPGCISEQPLSWFIPNIFIPQEKSLVFQPQSASSLFNILKSLLDSLIFKHSHRPQHSSCPLLCQPSGLQSIYTEGDSCNQLAYPTLLQLSPALPSYHQLLMASLQFYFFPRKSTILRFLNHGFCCLLPNHCIDLHRHYGQHVTLEPGTPRTTHSPNLGL